mmetsp:Transcript_1715/g.3038  ORF Transcript_1715/g.3038 Transcript_1715/m.3038 type:complete len:85 (-) Transcript_1715:745-999(-)
MTYCWYDEFLAWYNGQSGAAAVTSLPQSEFDVKLYEWATTTDSGKAKREQQTIGFINKKLKYMKIYAKLNDGWKDSVDAMNQAD